MCVQLAPVPDPLPEAGPGPRTTSAMSLEPWNLTEQEMGKEQVNRQRTVQGDGFQEKQNSHMMKAWGGSSIH